MGRLASLVITLVLTMAFASCSPEVYKFKQHVTEPDTPNQIVREHTGVIKITKNKIKIKNDLGTYWNTIKYTKKPSHHVLVTEMEYMVKVWEGERCLFFINMIDAPFGCLICEERASEFFFFETTDEWIQRSLLDGISTEPSVK